ncbi:MAG: hypothetical protein Alpg2KO_15700 [Alphaproteobacteria bacterium]
MSIASSEQRCLKGSIVTVLDTGDTDRPFRAWADLVAPDKNGMEASRARILLEAPAGTDLQAGDDIWGIGRKVSSGIETVPNKIILASDGQVDRRLRGQVEGGAALRAFGQILADNTPEDRPGSIALSRLTPNTLLIARGKADIPDPITDWAARLTDGLANRSTRMVMPVDAPTGRTALEDLLTRDLPQQYAEQMASSLAQQAEQDPAGHWFVTSARGRVRPHDYALAVVKPYDITRTASDLWEGLSQYQMPGFMPRNCPDLQTMRRFTAAHEMAHTVQEDFDIAHQGPPHHINKKESFADAFALLAMARDGADADSLESLVQMREASLIPATLLTHFTGPAARAALDHVRKTDLSCASNHDLARKAAQIATDHALTEQQWTDLHHIRKKVLEDGGCRYAESQNPANPYLLQDITGGVLPANLINAAMQANPDQFGEWKSAFSSALNATKEISYTAGMLQDETLKNSAVTEYVDDLSAVISDLKDKHPSFGHAVLRRQSDGLNWLLSATPPDHLKQLKAEMDQAISLQSKRLPEPEGTDPKASESIALSTLERGQTTGLFIDCLKQSTAQRRSDFINAIKAEHEAITATPIDHKAVEALQAKRSEIGLCIGLIDTPDNAMTDLITDSAQRVLIGRGTLDSSKLVEALKFAAPSPTAPPAP